MATNFAWTKPTAQASRQVSASLASGARFGNGHKHPPTKKQQTAAKPRAYAARTPGGGSGGRMVGIPVGGGKPSVEKKILGALAELEILGITNPSRVQIALFSGYTNVKSAGFAKAVSIAKAKGSIEYPSSKSMRLTSKGKWEAPPTLNPPQTNADVHIRIKKLLKPTAVQLFDLLADGLPHPREEVAEAMGYTNQKVSSHYGLPVRRVMQSESELTALSLFSIFLERWVCQSFVLHELPWLHLLSQGSCRLESEPSPAGGGHCLSDKRRQP